MSFVSGFEKTARQYFVYRNVNKSKDEHVYSLKDKDSGRVEKHTSHLLLKDPRFRVGHSGRKRVTETGVKNVHAGIHGESVESVPTDLNWQPLTYNPKKDESFIDRDTKMPVTEARYAKLTPRGVFYA